MGRVIVGVDGSEAADRALAFAVEEARMRGAALQVVFVQEPAGEPAHLSGAAYATAGSFESMAAWEREQREVLERRAREHGEHVLNEVLEGLDTSGVTVEKTLLFDHRPARQLVDLAASPKADVELLVVGSRGRGELTGLLLGSVSQACVTHARVPVTVVPSRRL